MVALFVTILIVGAPPVVALFVTVVTVDAPSGGPICYCTDSGPPPPPGGLYLLLY